MNANVYINPNTEKLETKTMAWIDEMSVSDEKVLSAAYGIKFGELPIYTKKTSAAIKNLRDRLATLEKIRDEKIRATMPPVIFVQCDCSHSVPESVVMSASRGSACPDCYDRMSD